MDLIALQIHTCNRVVLSELQLFVLSKFKRESIIFKFYLKIC